ncbi:outer membrane protein assembly factor BamB family protein [Pseudanabaena yagii]|uniref:PQQ-binding-like beta-propeller repeat protein n=1 Tax=Pseudanabaena yagii GIHE-NHR1 TaxID=2722753 RepID=A0ABX1LTI4_9CYAN|nr:PQQ-binding-like beta-propeller repeat protein [Pseudanabaena yagii]NMF58350.1 PQQ-binding-like beta-propeller repeat protein [Pseudanabaena yagii GIHE-NHR1]
MKVIPSKLKLPYSRKLINFGKYFLISLVLLLGLHLVANANNSEVIIQPEWTANLQASTELITNGKQVFIIENQKYSEESRDYSATLFAIHTASGKVQWQQQLPPHQSLGSRKLILENGIIYASHDNGIVGFDPETGSPKTSLKYVEDMGLGGIRDRLMGIHQDIAVYGDSIPIDESSSNLAGYQTKVFAINKEKPLWSYQLPKTNGLIGISAIQPVVQNGILFLPSFHDTSKGRLEQFTVMDVRSGKVLWTWETSSRDPNALWDADILGDTIYTSIFGFSKTQPLGRIRAIDLQTGKEKWSYVITGKVKAVSDREVLVWQSKDNSGGNFVLLDKETGRFLRRFTVTRAYDSEPQHLTWADGRVYIDDMEIKNVTLGFYGSADNNSWIGAFDDKTGKLVWRTPTLMNSHVYYPPLVIAVADKPDKKRLIFASNFLRKEGSSKIQSFFIP